MSRFLGTVDTALTFSVLSATALDPRVVVDTKEELTKTETWPQSGESVYVYDGQVVYVKSEQCAYALVDKNNYTNVNSWKYVGGYEDIYAYDIKSEAIQDAGKIVAGKLTFDMISNTTTVGGICYDENNNYFYRIVQISGATGAVETRYYLTWGDLGDNIVTSEELGEVKDGKTYPKANTTYYCEYQDADGKQDFTIPSDFNGFVSGKLYISVLNGKMYKASSTNSLITVSGGDSSYLLNRLIALEKVAAEDDVLEFGEMVNTEDIVEPSVAANNYTIMFDTHNKQFVAYENGVYYANWKENDFNKPSATYGEKQPHGIKPIAGKIYIDITTNQIYRWNGVDLIALNATADSIKIGKNDDGNTYKIALNSDGSGHLANKGIEWNKDGDVTFGPNVTLNWSNIENPPIPSTGEGIFKSTVFTRTNDINISNIEPEGGDYSNPIPDATIVGDKSYIWSDGIPDGEEILWASTRVFSTLGEDSELELVKEGWTTPKKMTDTASFNVEFSKLETPKAPTNFIDGETEEQWRAKNRDWENEAFENTIWMATNTRKNGVWDGWRVSKIKGEKGDDGTSISIKKGAKIVPSKDDLSAISNPVEGDICFVGSIEDMDAVVLYVYQENGWVVQTGMQVGDSYLVDEWLFMWAGESWIKSQFKGDPGKSSYIHIKYANSLNPGDWTGRGNDAGQQIIPDEEKNNIWGETPGSYMGIYSDNIKTDSKNWNSYKWTKWEGRDGMGYEYVYRSTLTNIAPELSEYVYEKNGITYNPENDGFIPENWSDDPISISSKNPFCWIAVRQKIDGKWTSFEDKVSLWAKWGSDSIKLDLDNDNDSIMYRDDTPISTVVSNAILYDGIAPVTAGVEYAIDKDNWGTAVGSINENQITINGISSSSTSVKVHAIYKGNKYYAILSIKKLVNTDKYEIICSPNAIPHNISNGDSQHTILVNTYKTDFTTGKRELLAKLPDGYTLICDVNNVPINQDEVDGKYKYVLEINDSNKPDSLTFILKKGKEVLDSETIPVNYTENGRGIEKIEIRYAISSSNNINDVKDVVVNGEIVESKVDWYESSPSFTPEKPYLWQRIRTIYTDFTNSEWSYNMIGSMGKDGVSPNAAFKSTVFTRTNDENISNINPEGGKYSNPIPDATIVGDKSYIWSDGIPDGEEMLWCSTRIFSSDDKYPQQDTWSVPKKMTDTSDFDVAFSRQITLNKDHAKPISHGDHTDEGKDNNGIPYWENEAYESTIWMATSTCKNGDWTDWQVSKIKGENGNDGTSINIKKGAKIVPDKDDLEAISNPIEGDECFVGSVDNMEGVKLYIYKNNGWIEKPEEEIITGDAYFVGEWLFVWDGDSWVKTQFKGDPGARAYVHIKYANSATKGDWAGRDDNETDIENNPNIPVGKKDKWGENPGSYIGIASNNIDDGPLNWSDYTWTKWQGEDGFGYEYIYTATQSETDGAPKLPNIEDFKTNVEYQKDGYVPEDWSDDPIDVHKELRYCWVCYRQKVGGVWQKFRGSKNTDGTSTHASLWTCWVKGENSIKLDLDNENDSMLYDGAGNCVSGNVVSNVSLYDGIDKVNNDNITWSISNSSGVNISNSSAINQDGYITSNTPITGPNGTYKIIDAGSYFNWDGSTFSIKICGHMYKNEVPWSNCTIYFNDGGNAGTPNGVINTNIGASGSVAKDKNRATTNEDGYFEYVMDNVFIKDYKLTALATSQYIGANIYPEAPEANVYPYMRIYRSESANGKTDAWITTDGKVTVTGVAETSNYVQVKGEYPKGSKKYYYANLTIKKLVGVDKYDLVITPNSITYNTSTNTPSAQSVDIYVYRTSQNGNRELVGNLSTYGLTLNINDADHGSYNDTNKYTLDIKNLITGNDIKVILKDSKGAVLDSETIPINKSADGTPGENSIRLDLDNEMDSMLYDDNNERISDVIVTNPTLYDGSTPVENANIKWELNVQNSEKDQYDFNSVSGQLTVNGISDTQNTVIYSIIATYKDVEYVSSLTIKKLVGVDKYDLIIIPNSFTYNTTTKTPSQSDGEIQVYRTNQKGERTLVDMLDNYGLSLVFENLQGSNPSGYEDGLSFDPNFEKDYCRVQLLKNDVIIDSETIPINKSKDGENGDPGPAGANAIRLDLDNENDSILYNGAGECVSGAVTSQAWLYDGGKEVDASDVEWVISAYKGVNLVGGGAAQDINYTNEGATNAWITVEGKITVNGVNESASYVQVRAEYPKNSDNYYYAQLTIKKLVNADKYELVVSPNAIAYNETTDGDKTQTINIEVYKTTVDKGRYKVTSIDELPEDAVFYAVNNGSLNKDNYVTFDNGVISFNWNYDLAHENIRFALTDDRETFTNILDSETIPINKSTNGDNGVIYRIEPVVSYFRKFANGSIQGDITGYLYKNDEPISHATIYLKHKGDNNDGSEYDEGTATTDENGFFNAFMTWDGGWKEYNNTPYIAARYIVDGEILASHVVQLQADGDDAVTYEIVPTNSYYTLDQNTNETNGIIEGILYKITGTSREVVDGVTIGYGYSNTIEDYSDTVTTKNGGKFSADFSDTSWIHPVNNKSNSILARYKLNNQIVAQFNVGLAKNGLPGEAGKQSAPLRVSEWAVGTTYYSGYEENAPWSDTVIYKDSASNTKQYYRCMKFHIAEDENAPGVVQSDNTKYWELYGGKFESVATGLLLAEKAYIDNLGVRSLSTNVTGERFTATGTEIAFYGKREYPAMRMSVDVFGKGRLEFLNQDTGEVTYVINEEGIKKWEDAMNAYVNEIISPAVTTYRMIGLPDGSDQAEQDWANYASNIFENDTTSTTDLYKYVAGRNHAGVVTGTKYCISVEFSENSDGRYFIFKPTDTQLLGSDTGEDGVTRYPYTGFFVKPDNVIHTQIRAYTNCVDGDTKSIPTDYNDHNNTLFVDWSVVDTYSDPNGYNGFRYKNPVQSTYVFRMYNGEFVMANKWDDPDPTKGQVPLHVYRNKYEYVKDIDDGGICWKEWDDPEIHYVYKDDSKYGYPI